MFLIKISLDLLVKSLADDDDFEYLSQEFRTGDNGGGGQGGHGPPTFFLTKKLKLKNRFYLKKERKRESYYKGKILHC